MTFRAGDVVTIRPEWRDDPRDAIRIVIEVRESRLLVAHPTIRMCDMPVTEVIAVAQLEPRALSLDDLRTGRADAMSQARVQEFNHVSRAACVAIARDFNRDILAVIRFVRANGGAS